jgi:2-polyprenyl-3-methyl-5-hydroxy-6-metoxy-1,4-benzoquinol methylase
MDNQFCVKIPSVNIALGRLEFVLEKCKRRKVLHLGCVDEVMLTEGIKEKNQLTHFMLSRVAREVWGMDISKKGIEMLRGIGVNNLFLGNIENIEGIKELKGQNFDIILATEILEHLNNPGLFLQGVKSLFSANTEMIITVPNALQFSAFEYGLRGFEFVHPAHNFYFSYRTLYNLLVKHNFEINQVLSYSNVDWRSSILLRIGSKIKRNFKRASLRKKKISSNEMLIKTEGSFTKINRNFKEIIGILIRRILYKRNPFFADGIIFVARYKNQ